MDDPSSSEWLREPEPLFAQCATVKLGRGGEGKKMISRAKRPCNCYQIVEAAAVDGFAKCARLTFTELTE